MVHDRVKIMIRDWVLIMFHDREDNNIGQDSRTVLCCNCSDHCGRVAEGADVLPAGIAAALLLPGTPTVYKER